jgi:hypothetical protein
MNKARTIAYLIFACPFVCLAQAGPAHMVVTIGHHYGHEPPVLTRDDLSVTTVENQPLTITNLIPLRGDRAGLEIYVLVDNCSSCEAGTKLQELSRFIASQLPSTAVGVASISNGRVTVTTTPTFDHERAVKALSAPAGSKPASPYDGLKELITAWSPTSSRRAVLMITNGLNPTATDKPEDPSAEAAIEAAQRAGVSVYAIYHPSADYATSDFLKIYDGQVQLAHVAHDTGGEAYFMGPGPLPSIAAFLADIADHLANQYLLEFLSNPADKPGALQDVTVKARNADIELMVPEKVWVSEAVAGR